MTIADGRVASLCGQVDRPVGPQRYLIFTLAGDQFALEILRVRQIRSWADVKETPDAPDYVLGVTDLQGDDLYVVDLRKRLALESISPNRRTMVIVLGFLSNGVNRPIGFTVDAVSDVYEFAVETTQRSTDFDSPVSRDFVRGITTVEGKRVTLLETDRLVDPSLVNRNIEARMPTSRHVH